jgi:hypothetical protein
MSFGRELDRLWQARPADCNLYVASGIPSVVLSALMDVAYPEQNHHMLFVANVSFIGKSYDVYESQFDNLPHFWRVAQNVRSVTIGEIGDFRPTSVERLNQQLVLTTPTSVRLTRAVHTQLGAINLAFGHIREFFRQGAERDVFTMAAYTAVAGFFLTLSGLPSREDGDYFLCSLLSRPSAPSQSPPQILDERPLCQRILEHFGITGGDIPISAQLVHRISSEGFKIRLGLIAGNELQPNHIGAITNGIWSRNWKLEAFTCYFQGLDAGRRSQSRQFLSNFCEPGTHPHPH